MSNSLLNKVSVLVIQRAVRKHQWNLHHEMKAQVISSITIQSYVRGWNTRRMNRKYKLSSVLIQVSILRSQLIWSLIMLPSACPNLFHHPVFSSCLSLLLIAFDISSSCLITLSFLLGILWIFICSYINPHLESTSLTC